VLRLFAPFLPFVTEEVWSWWQQPADQTGKPTETGQPAETGQPGRYDSIHRAAWPDGAELRALAGPDAAALDAASLAIASIRKAKSQAKLPMKARVRRLAVSAPADLVRALAAVQADVQAAGRVDAVDLRPAAEGKPVLDVTL
jgi:valyl-tRNA synthetase